MKTSWIVGLFTLLFAMALISGVMEMVYLGSTEQSRLWALLHPQFVEFNNPLTFIVGFFNTAWSWLGNLFAVLSFDYAYFQDEWAIVRWMIFFPISAGIVWGVVSMLRGSSSA